MNLTKTQEVDLIAAESVIEKGLATFVEVGDSLTKIRDGKLYLLNHATFEDYCRERWGMSRQHAFNLITASEVVGDLSTMVDKGGDPAPKTQVPKTERVAREVAKAPREKRKEAWDKAVETAPKDADGTSKVTAAHARKAVAAVVTPEPPAPKPDEPPPVRSGPPLYAAEVAEVDAVCDDIDRSLAKLTRLLKANAAEKRCAVPFAHFVSYLGTLGEIRAGNKSLRDAMPGGASEKPPGYIPRSSVKIRNRGEAA